MFAIVGTVPDLEFPLSFGPVAFNGKRLMLKDQVIDIQRGTPALIAAAAQVCLFFNAPMPVVYLVGDIGKGKGSRELYAYLEKNLPDQNFSSLTFHYVQPDVDWHNRVLFAIETMAHRPILIADAGFMYAAKMSGQASLYDVFTPDIGELAFLADPEAPHPFYTRGFIFHESHRIEKLIADAYAHDNAARFLMVKGEKDLLADRTGILETISDPMVHALEPIGGTGDIITGLVAAFTGIGENIKTACVLSAHVSRRAGKRANPNPGTQVMTIIDQIPSVLEEMIPFYNELKKNG